MAPPIDSPKTIRREIIAAAPSLPAFGDPNASLTAAGTTVRPGDVIQRCRSKPAQLSDFHLVIDCCDAEFVCYHPASGRYAVLPLEFLDVDLNEDRRTHYDSVIKPTDCDGEPAVKP